jgi:hypothetical protein
MARQVAVTNGLLLGCQRCVGITARNRIRPDVLVVMQASKGAPHNAFRGLAIRDLCLTGSRGESVAAGLPPDLVVCAGVLFGGELAHDLNRQGMLRKIVHATARNKCT